MGDYWRALRSLWPSTGLFFLIIIVSTVGYEAMGWSLPDALYMVIITVFTVGYGETQPVDTPMERAWTMIIIVAGWLGLLTTLGSVVSSVTNGELGRTAENLRRKRTMEHLKDHVIICGYGRIGQTVARELLAAHVPFVVIDKEKARLDGMPEDVIYTLLGDATEEETLVEAGLARARALATVLPQDAANVFITLTARNLSPTIQIIARGEQPSTERKLLQAGANEVVLPTSIGGQRIAHAISKPAITQLLADTRGLDFHAMGVEVDELALTKSSGIAGKSVASLQRQCAGDLLVLAVRRAGQLIQENVDKEVLQPGDSLLVIGRVNNLPEIVTQGVLKTELL